MAHCTIRTRRPSLAHLGFILGITWSAPACDVDNAPDDSPSDGQWSSTAGQTSSLVDLAPLTMRRIGGYCPSNEGCETVVAVNHLTLTVQDSTGELFFNLTSQEVDRLASLVNMPEFHAQMAIKPNACDTGHDGQIFLIFGDENGAPWQQQVQFCPHENILRQVADLLFTTMVAHLECPFFDATTTTTTTDDLRRWACVDCGELCQP